MRPPYSRAAGFATHPSDALPWHLGTGFVSRCIDSAFSDLYRCMKGWTHESLRACDRAGGDPARLGRLRLRARPARRSAAGVGAASPGAPASAAAALAGQRAWASISGCACRRRRTRGSRPCWECRRGSRSPARCRGRPYTPAAHGSRRSDPRCRRLSLAIEPMRLAFPRMRRPMRSVRVGGSSP